MPYSEDELERKLQALGSAERAFIRESFKTRRPDAAFIVSESRRQIDAQSFRRPTQRTGLIRRLFERTNILDRLFPSAPVWSTAAVVTILSLGICLGVLLHMPANPSDLMAFKAVPGPDPAMLPRPASDIPGVTQTVGKPPDSIQLPDNVDLDFNRKQVRFHGKDKELSGPLTALPSGTPDIATFNFTATGTLGINTKATARGTLVLTKRAGVQAIRSKSDVQSVKVTATLEFLRTQTNTIEKAYGP